MSCLQAFERILPPMNVVRFQAPPTMHVEDAVEDSVEESDSEGGLHG